MGDHSGVRLPALLLVLTATSCALDPERPPLASLDTQDEGSVATPAPEVDVEAVPAACPEGAAEPCLFRWTTRYDGLIVMNCRMSERRCLPNGQWSRCGEGTGLERAVRGP